MPDCRPYNRPVLPHFGYTNYEGDGSTDTFTIPWDYITKDTVAAGAPVPYIYVYVNGTEVDYTLASSTTLTITSGAPADGADIEIIRESSLAARLVAWDNNTPLTSANMERFSKQVQFLIQEIWSRLLGLACSVDEINNDGTFTEYLAQGDGTTVNFSLQPETELTDQQVIVFINGVRQGTDTYSANESGGYSRITFDEAPKSTDKLSFLVIGAHLVAYTIVDGSITTAKLADCSVTYPKLCLSSYGTDNQYFIKRSGDWIADEPSYTDIPDFNTGVRLNKVHQLAAPTADFSMNSNKITNLATPTASGDAVTKAYADDLLADHAKGSATLVVVSGVTSSVTVNVGFEPKHVMICLQDCTWIGSQIGAVSSMFALATTSAAENQTVAILRNTGSSSVYGEVKNHSLQLTSTGFTYTFFNSGLNNLNGDISYVAFRR